MATEIRRTGYAVVLLVLICALAIESIECRKRVPQTSNFDSEGGWKSSQTDEQTAERIRNHCRKELININALEDFGVNMPPEGTIDLTSTVLTEGHINKDINLLPRQIKQTLSDCIRRESLLYDVSVKRRRSGHWYLKHIELLSSLTSAPRRYLISEQTRQRAKKRALGTETESETASPGPAPEASKGPSHSPQPTAAPQPAAGKNSPPAPQPAAEKYSPSAPQPAAEKYSPSAPQPAAEKYSPPAPQPAAGKHSSPTPQPAAREHSPSPEPAAGKHSPATPQPAAGKHSPHAPQHSARKHSPPDTNILEEDNEDGSAQMEVIIAIATTAVTTFALFSLLYLFCLRDRQNQIGPGDRRKDDRPIPILSSSAASSQNSLNLGGPGDKEPTDNGENNSSLVRTSSMNADINTSSPSEGPSSEAAAGLDQKPPPEIPAPPPPLPPPPLPPARPNAPPPPPSKVPLPPRNPIPGKMQPPPPGPHRQEGSEQGELDSQPGAPKTKLKPFFWDKVLASPDQAMVWHEIHDGSFQLNEAMMESLFGYTGDKKKTEGRKSSSAESTGQGIQIIDRRKAQNLSIILRALNLTTEEVVDALEEGTELPLEFLESCLKMAPTADEELKLRLFSGDVSQLGVAERFLKVMIEIPFAYKRVESLIYMSYYQEEVTGIKESFKTLEVACDKLKSSRLFLKLLEAVLKTGNRMNVGTYRGGAQAIKLDTLLKLSDVKGTDGKTTLLHFVVQEIIRSEGIRAVRTKKESQNMPSVKSVDFNEDPNLDSAENYRSLGLQVVSGLSTELVDVKKAALIDGDGLTASVAKLSNSMSKVKGLLDSEMKNMEEGSEFRQKLTKFVESAEADIPWILAEEKRIMSLVKSTVDYFHGNSGKDEGLRVFTIVRDFLIMLDKACKEVKDTTKPLKTSKKETSTSSPSSENRQPFADKHRKLFPAIEDRRMDFSSSDDES